MQKRLIGLLVVFCLAFSIIGCDYVYTRKAYTFMVETGDSVKVELDTSDQYDITPNLPFKILCDGNTLSQGIFTFAENYEQYMEKVEADENARLIDSGTKDGNQYIFWSYSESEYDYAILIGDSNTGIILSNNVSEESARECFERLTITVE